MTPRRSTIAVRFEGAGRRARLEGVSATTVRRWAGRMLECLDLGESELSIVLCDDPFIHDLNQRYAGEDHATDVLAFATGESPGPRAPGLLGDVVISLETAARQAPRHHVAADAEVRLLLAHGLLHLIGYDHRTTAEKRIMTARTDVLLAAASPPVAARKRAPRGTRRSTPARRPT